LTVFPPAAHTATEGCMEATLFVRTLPGGEAVPLAHYRPPPKPNSRGEAGMAPVAHQQTPVDFVSDSVRLLAQQAAVVQRR
jgi:hypothetical protein